MTQWLLLRNGVLHCRGGAVSIALASSSSSAAGVFTPLCTRSRLVFRRFSSAPDRHRRNHFKSNRDYKDKVREERSEADGKPKFSNWSLFDSTSGVGGRAASASAKSGGGAANGSAGASRAPKKQRSAFGQRHANDAAKKDAKQNFTNKFQNLLSFALDDDDDDDDVGTQKESPSPSRFGSKSAHNQSPFVTSNNRNGRISAAQPKRVQAEEDESDDDDIFTDNNDLAISALALDHDDDDDGRRELPVVSKVKKTAKPRAEEAKKKQLKHQKKKDGRSLLKSFKFENSIFGGDDDFFGDVEWDDRDNDMREERRFKRQQRKADRNAHKIVLPPQEVEIPTRILVKDLAERMSIKSKVLIRALRDLGEHATEDSVLVNEVAELVVESLNMIPVLLPPEFVDAELTIPPADCSAFPVRPPVVSVMGHVDHGKTTLLDALRQSKVAASEAGGITQTIGAFTVALGGQFGSMTFIDTPGHAAFSSMRSMGSEVTDMIVLVVAADDGVRPQTQEVVELAQKNKVPLVVAVTKVDMHAQSRDEVAQRISSELLTFGVVTESMGGDTPLVCVSSKTGEGLETLKETIALYAEVLDLRADTTPPGEAVVIESKMARGVGPQVDTVVKWGTLKTGAVVVCGLEYGKIRALIGPDGKTRVKMATPGMPVRVVGLKGLPKAGEPLLMVPSEDRAKEVVQQRLEMIEWDRLAATEEAEAQAMEASGEEGHVRRRRYMGAAAKSRQIEQRRQEAEDEAKRVAALKVGEHGYEAKIVPIIVKTDSMGVIAAIDDLIASLPTDEAVIKRIVGAVGPVSSSDLALAEATGATVYHFNVKHATAIDHEAFQKDVALRAHDVIYSLLDDIKALLEDHLGGVEETEVVGAAEILQQIPITKSGRRVVHIAGCRVTSGALGMQNKYRLVRDGQVVASDVSMETMRHFQDKVSEVTKGQECGLQLHGLESFQVGDVLEAYTVKIVKKRV